MLGHNVSVCLLSPSEVIKGQLRKQDPSGIWVYMGFQEQARVVFFPAHRIERMEDNGDVYR